MPNAPNPAANDDRHPPLAHDQHGNMLPIPKGTAAWRLMRQTRGRPRVVCGPDGEPLRFPLELDAETLADMCGSGTYRVYALDEVGNQLDYVTTVVAGPDVASVDVAPVFRNAASGVVTSPSTDLRFALETIAHMSRTYADSLRAVTEAQADWVKTIAIAKGLPRNVAPSTRRLLEAGDDEDDDDDDRDDDEDQGEPSRPAAPQSGADVLFAHLAPLMPELMGMWRSWVAERMTKKSPTDQAPADKPRNAVGASAAGSARMLHLAQIQARLTPRERRFLDAMLVDEEAEAIASELVRRSVDDAVRFIRDNIDATAAAVDAERAARAARAKAAAPPSADVPPNMMTKLAAALRNLGPSERMRLVALQPRIVADASYMAEVSAIFEPMTVEEVAAWLRENLDRIEARFSS